MFYQILFTVLCFRLCCCYDLEKLNLKEKQLFVFKLLNHITEPSVYEDVIHIAADFSIQDNLDSFTNTEYVQEFARSVQKGQLHPRGESFCLFCDEQLQQAITTFFVLYYANNFATFLKTSCWLRQNVNEGLFVYSFSVAVRHRDDCRSLILPAIYETYPFLFVTQNTVQVAKIVKMKMDTFDKDLNADYGVSKNGNVIEITDNSYFYISEDDRVSYFTKDIGLNTYYYNFHVDYPFWMGDEVYGLTIDRRGELYIYLHRQLLARYYLERLSNRMCDIESFEPAFPIVPGNYPDTTLHNEWSIPHRPNNVKIGKDKSNMLKEISNFQQRLRDAVVNGFILSYDGTKIDMRRVEGVEVLGRRIYGNLDKTDRDLLYFYELMARNLVSAEFYVHGVQVPTSVLQFYEKSLTDPLFWTLQKSTMELVDKFYHDHIRSAHRKDDVFFAGVKISSVAVTKLITYFEDHNIDITNALPLTRDEENLKQEKIAIFAKKSRLNHIPFDVSINIISDKATKCIIRLYLGPKDDCNGNTIKTEDNVHNFVELDLFVTSLNVGNNSIVRNSRDFNNIITDIENTRTLWTQFNEKHDINFTSYLHRHSGFPSNLIIPKGSKGGTAFTLFVMVSSFEKQRAYSGFNIEEVRAKKLCRFNLCLHSVPLGFPFNKNIRKETFTSSNARFIDVIVFHKNKKDFDDALTVIHPF